MIWSISHLQPVPSIFILITAASADPSWMDSNKPAPLILLCPRHRCWLIDGVKRDDLTAGAGKLIRLSFSYFREALIFRSKEIYWRTPQAKHRVRSSQGISAWTFGQYCDERRRTVSPERAKTRFILKRSIWPSPWVTKLCIVGTPQCFLQGPKEAKPNFCWASSPHAGPSTTSCRRLCVDGVKFHGQREENLIVVVKFGY